MAFVTMNCTQKRSEGSGEGVAFDFENHQIKTILKVFTRHIRASGHLSGRPLPVLVYLGRLQDRMCHARTLAQQVN